MVAGSCPSSVSYRSLWSAWSLAFASSGSGAGSAARPCPSVLAVLVAAGFPTSVCTAAARVVAAFGCGVGVAHPAAGCALVVSGWGASGCAVALSTLLFPFSGSVYSSFSHLGPSVSFILCW